MATRKIGANLARRVTFFSKIAFGKCRRVWRVLAKQVGEYWGVWRVLSKHDGKFGESGIFGQYSHSLNSRASSHCLILTLYYYFSPLEDTALIQEKLKIATVTGTSLADCQKSK